MFLYLILIGYFGHAIYGLYIVTFICTYIYIYLSLLRTYFPFVVVRVSTIHGKCQQQLCVNTWNYRQNHWHGKLRRGWGTECLESFSLVINVKYLHLRGLSRGLNWDNVVTWQLQKLRFPILLKLLYNNLYTFLQSINKSLE